MKSRKTEFMIDFPQLKQKKQFELTHLLSDLYDGLFDYIEREANLREKVRAKEIYRHKTGLGRTNVLTEDEETHFNHWFAFDYVTVIGSRMFDLYIREKQEDMDPKTLEIAGMMMLMHLEPYYVKGTVQNKLVVSPLFDPYTQIPVEPLQATELPEQNEFVFARTLKLGFDRKLIGPTFTIMEDDEQDVAERLLTASEQGQLAYRKYLKEYGIDFRKYCGQSN